MLETPTCPHCGYDLRRDAPMFTDLWFMDPRGTVIYREQLIHFPRQHFAFLWTLFKNQGRIVGRDAMFNRITDHSEEHGDHNVGAVIACKLRAKFLELDIPCPFSNVWGMGWRWDRDLTETL